VDARDKRGHDGNESLRPFEQPPSSPRPRFFTRPGIPSSQPSFPFKEARGPERRYGASGLPFASLSRGGRFAALQLGDFSLVRAVLPGAGYQAASGGH